MSSEYKPSAGEHPITPPPELVQQCWDELRDQTQVLDAAKAWDKAIALAYQAGADQELEACCKWLPKLPPWSADDLRKHRRPKPPSLKELALEALQFVDEKLKGHLPLHNHCNAIHTISRALEQLPN